MRLTLTHRKSVDILFGHTDCLKLFNIVLPKPRKKATPRRKKNNQQNQWEVKLCWFDLNYVQKKTPQTKTKNRTYERHTFEDEKNCRCYACVLCMCVPSKCVRCGENYFFPCWIRCYPAIVWSFVCCFSRNYLEIQPEYTRKVDIDHY